MPVRKQRAKTGCLSCRQRRVKCDERRPNCLRCEKANILCNGYEAPRKLSLKSSSTTTPTSASQFQPSPASLHLSQPSRDRLSHSTPSGEEHLLPSISGLASHVPTQRISSLVTTEIVSGNLQRAPHSRALEALAYQQYTAKTTALLFHVDHQSFWNGFMLEAAWNFSFIYDAIVALGAMHRAVLLLSHQHTRQLGGQTQVIAFEAYGNALTQLQSICQEAKCIDRGLLIGVLLLLTYFEVFTGNAASAFRHLRTARHYITEYEERLAYHEALLSCTNELSLVAQIVLPVEHFPLYASQLGSSTERQWARSFQSSTQFCPELQRTLDFICQYPDINRAVWTPLSRPGDFTNLESILAYQQQMLALISSLVADKTLHELITSIETEVAGTLENEFRLPITSIEYESTGPALAHALFCCYMARTYYLLSIKDPQGRRLNARKASKYAYHIMRIAQGLNLDVAEGNGAQMMHTTCNDVRMGFTPLIYTAATILNDPPWHQWAASKLRSIEREGLYNAEYFAKALDLMNVFRARTRAIENVEVGTNSIIPILIPDADGTCLAIYYARPLRFVDVGMITPVEVLGCARWSQPSENTQATSENLTIDFYEKTHPLNDGEFDRCLYWRIPQIETNAGSWSRLFSLPTVVRVHT